jgi:hypothetical protein
MEEIAPALGKLDEGTQEVIQTSWVNGLHIDLSHLESLLNSNELTAIIGSKSTFVRDSGASRNECIIPQFFEPRATL